MKIKSLVKLSTLCKDVDTVILSVFLDNYHDRIYKSDSKQIKKNILLRPENGHKGTFGHTLIIAGNEGTPGACILSSKAALKTGCGLITSLIPAEAIIPLLVHLPEAMVINRINQNSLFALNLDKFDAIGFGPGAGMGTESTEMLHYLLKNYKGKLVIDADGLTILSKNKSWFSLLNTNTILTPHPVEFDRMTKIHSTEMERIQTQINFADEYGVHILVKGHYTTIVANKKIYFNATGNNGMATAGSGDVLTGIITSLCAQGYDSGDAAIMGTFLHGYAGDEAAKKFSMHSMIASDIINEIGAFFIKFET